MKVAIVHDWLIGGGAERVVQALHEMYPDAPIYTSYCTDEWRKRLDGKVVTGWLQHWPFSRLRKFSPVLRIWWFTRLNLSGYDLVISSTGNGEAKGIRVPKGTTHICYCHSPTHFYWRHYDQYLSQPGFGVFNPLVRVALRILIGPLRRWDLKASKRPDYYIANSSHIQTDINTYYGREATVIHPPVELERFSLPEPGKRQGFVVAGRQVPQKKTDLAVLAAKRLGAPLTVLGKGPEHKRLVAMGGPTITYQELVSDAEMPVFFSQAEAFIFPALDDFGIMPIEAMAAGTPVIAYKAGGALDYVVDGKTGVFFDKQDVPSLTKALRQFAGHTFNRGAIRAQAQNFSPEHFKQAMHAFIANVTRQN
jgi:glycosyltransferase involved in cell wall biosynthesis